ncbi:MAG TPA: hypothetical protein DCM62_10140 [Bacteroidales bacterium]|nr:hypothetical protein [Bacteroidales bacterium]
MNFEAFVNLLKEVQTPEFIKLVFGESVPVPNKDLIFEAKKIASQRFSDWDNFTKFPDPKHWLSLHLAYIANFLLPNKATIERYRLGRTDTLEMEEIGIVWAFSEAFLKYYAILNEYDKPKHQKPAKQANESIGLEQMFAPEKLKDIIARLKDKNFIAQTANGYQWQGIDNPIADGKGLQFVALAYYCQNKGYYKQISYQQKELHKAWTIFFNYKISKVMFCKRNYPNDSYFNLFANL